MSDSRRTPFPSPHGVARLRWRDVAVLYGVAAVALALASLEGDGERLVVGALLILLTLGFIVMRIRRATIEAERQARRDFLATMSHDLRTPLNSVIGFSNVLLKTAPSKLTPQEIQYLERVRANGVQLLDVVDGLLARAAESATVDEGAETAPLPPSAPATERESAAGEPAREQR